MMGTKFVEERTSAGLFNCSFRSTQDLDQKHGYIFGWIMDALMLGVGVGFDTKGAGTIKINSPKYTEDVFVIPDDREGWVRSVVILLDGFFKGEGIPKFDYSKIRPYGSPIRGFGGTASGSGPLEELHRELAELYTARSESENPFITSTDIVDTENLIGKCVVAGNVRRCLPLYSRVYSSKGILEIKNIKLGDEVLCSDGSYRKVKNIFNQGVQKLVKVKTANGDFECTANHKVAVLDGLNSYKWKMAAELTERDRLISRAQTMGLETMTEDEAWLLGFYAGDGHADVESCKERNGGGGMVSFAMNRKQANSELGERLVSTLKNLGYNPKVRSYEENNYVHFNVYRKDLAEKLLKVKKPNNSSVIIEDIWNGTLKIRSAFLAGLADADGGKGGRNILVYSKYKNFLKDVQKLALSVGIATRLHERPRKKIKGRGEKTYEGSHNLVIRGIASQKVARDFINPVSSFWKCQVKNAKKNGLNIPHEIILNSKEKGEININLLSSGLIRSSRSIRGSYRDANHDTLIEMSLCDPNLIPVEIMSVKESSLQETIDIEVEGMHEFIAEGFLVHNSAALALGAHDDMEYLTMKNDQEKLMNHRWGSNNSFHAIIGQDYEWHAEQSQKNGEPGYIWLDSARTMGRFKDGYRDDDLNVAGFNPCFAGDTKLLTENGWETFRDLYESQEKKFIVQDARVSYTGPEIDGNNPDYWNVEWELKNESCKNLADPVRLTRHNAPITKVVTTSGLELRVTPDHHIATQRGMVEAQDLTKEDKILVGYSDSDWAPQKDSVSYMLGTLLGELVGGGIIYSNSTNPRVTLSFWGEEQERVDHITSIIDKLWGLYGDWGLYGEELGYWCESNNTRKIEPYSVIQIENRLETRINSTFLHRLFVQEGYYQPKESNKLNWNKDLLTNESFLAGYVSGLIMTDGTISFTSKERGLSIRIGQSNKPLLQELQLSLLQFGIFGKIHKRRSQQLTELPNGKGGYSQYLNKDSYELVFTGSGRDKLYAQVTLVESKDRKYTEARSFFNESAPTECFWTKLEDLVHDGYEDVYCLSENKRRTVIANGIVARRCSEQQLESAELCCLCETFPAKHDSYEDYLRTLKVAYMYGKTVTLANTHWPETNAIMLKNRRIGLSQSGVIQAFNKHGRRNMLNWCDKAYDYVSKLDKEYSDWLCVPRSVRTTSIKPSGSVSLLNGSTPGIHYPEDEFYIRRIRFSKDHDLVKILFDAGYHIEDCKYSPNTKVASFPVKEENFTKGKREVSMWEQLEIAAQYQYYWADNSVSVTVTFKAEEADQLKTAIELYESRLKSVSFLRYQETGYEQAPYEPITEEQYVEMSKNIKPLDTSLLTQQGGGTRFCDGDTCMI